ncbi:MAG: TIGR03790 family protein [Planctomycetes bacterium]|nr:TIGR03790 family protein [Planctomycetota bacterium]
MRRILAALLILMATPLWALEPSEVLVLANSKAEGSVEIAQYYAGLRNIPTGNILTISTSINEEITREEYNKEIRDVVKAWLADHSQILCIVPARGVPLKVKGHTKPTGLFEGHTEAGVDSELMCIRLDEEKLDGARENPFIEQDRALTVDDKLMIVCRLDGPTVEIAKGLVEKALLAEACTPEGHSYLDTRGLPPGNDGYVQRDDIMEQVEGIWKSMAIPYTHDTKPDVVDLSTFEQPLHYYGWYAGGQKPVGAVRFHTGGIDVHLHSFAGATLRNTAANWCAPLLSWNATCTYGTVYEPYTTGFPYEHIFWDRLSKGFCFGEAGMMANHLISWQSVFVGDPLYTPYPKDWKASKEKRRLALAGMVHPPNEGTAPEVNAAWQGLFDACVRLLKARAEVICTLVKTNPAEAVKLKADLGFLIWNLGLDDAVGVLLEPLNKVLKEQLGTMKSEFKSDPRNTAALEAALRDWKGLAIEKDLLEFKEEVAQKQEKEFAALMKTAHARFKGKRYLDAWQSSAQAQRFRFAPSLADAKALQDQIKADPKAAEKLNEEAGKELKKLHEAAQKDFERKRYDKVEAAIKPTLDDYPECDEKKACAELLKQAEAKLKEAAKGK